MRSNHWILRRGGIPLAACLLLLLGGCTGCASKEASIDGRPDERVRARPQVRVAGPTHVFKGPVPVYGQGAADFVLVNEADEVLELRLLRKTCPCLDVTLPEAPVLLAPRSETTIAMSMMAPPLDVLYQHMALFWAGRPGSEPDFDDASEDGHLIELGLSMRPQLDFFIRPSAIDEVTGGAGTSFSRRVRIRRFEGGAVHVRSITMQNLPIEPRFTVEEDADGAAWVQVESRYPADPGMYQGVMDVLIRGTAQGDDRDVTVHVPISLRVRPRGQASPAGVVFRSDATESAPTPGRVARVTIHDPAGAVPLRAGFSGRESGLTAELTPSPGAPGQWDIEIRLDPAVLEHPKGSSRLEVRDADGNVVADVPVVWYL